MATKHTDMCLVKAADDEPIFVLRAQDLLAPRIVREWVARAMAYGLPEAKAKEALDLAERMEQWPTRKYPD